MKILSDLLKEPKNTADHASSKFYAIFRITKQCLVQMLQILVWPNGHGIWLEI